MIRMTVLAALAAVVAPGMSAAAPAVAAERYPIEPGYWESTNKLLSPIRQTKTERRCIKPADVEKFLSGPSNRQYACTYPTKVFADGKIRLKGSCVSKKGRKVEVAGSGAYTSNSFTLTADIATELLGLDITGRASTDARRIGDTCPSPEAPAGS